MSTSFYDEVGPMAIGSRLRRLGELVTEDARKVYDLYGVGLEPKWWPVFYSLSCEPGGLSNRQIARRIGHSHASVSQIVAAMCSAGLLDTARSTSDGRVKVIRLTSKARRLLPLHRTQCSDVSAAVDELLSEIAVDLWAALGDLERRLEKRPLFDRVKERFRRRETEKVEIIDYRGEDAGAFRSMNLEWIRQHWEVESTDLEYLDDPKGTILEPGGAILMALYEGRVVGTVALIPMDDGRYELAKMAVTPEARGKGIGWRLGRAAVERVREMGGDRVYLESNTILEPAIALYRKLGFRTVRGGTSPYDRCNIQMEVEI